MNKKKTRAFGKNVYLLGCGKDGVYYWLKEASFDCHWYWGIGYIESYTNNKNPHLSKDIASHNHFLFKFPNTDTFFDFFENSVLSNKEKWTFYELMKTLHILREYSDMLYKGGAHITQNPCADIIKNTDEYIRINNLIIPDVLEKVYDILSPPEEIGNNKVKIPTINE